MYIYIHSTIIDKSQKVQATQVSTHGRMDKQKVVYTYNEISFNLKKEGILLQPE